MNQVINNFIRASIIDKFLYVIFGIEISYWTTAFVEYLYKFILSVSCVNFTNLILMAGMDLSMIFAFVLLNLKNNERRIK